MKMSEKSGQVVATEPQSRRSRRWAFREKGILIALCGVLVCRSFGLGLGSTLCHGLLVAALGVPSHKVDFGSSQAQ
ncbi:hypothetical protein [Pseudodesulfovibrio piezophilus]|uniref:Uncharacterized protein n=1 Tax=Pseudodesulfovibrio piezophilus (strain DSM 21447 / JCM 15486 / C1TLV30) TaxID=1322246 RepID=M1WS58_PSEP2|nr:hypothetical protein [Pseudodesulfovibrio piezophilus]CCH48727.1 protein of unknown function [Pseudodesulfovibrio piezophilus C1TLV30]